MPRHHCPCHHCRCCRCHCCTSKRGTVDDAKAPSAVLPPSSRKQARDGQQCPGTIVCAATTAIVHPPPPPTCSLQAVHCPLSLLPAQGHHHHHYCHNVLFASKRRCPSSRRKPHCLPWPWHLFWCKGRCWDRPPPTVPPPRPPPQLPRRWWQSPLGQRGGGYGATVIVKATDLPRTGHCCLPGGRDHHDATIWVHPALPRCPLTPLHLTTAMPTRCHGEAHS